MRQDVFDNLLVAEKLKDSMKPEAKRYLEKLIKLGRRNGKACSLLFTDHICTEISNLISLDLQLNDVKTICTEVSR